MNRWLLKDCLCFVSQIDRSNVAIELEDNIVQTKSKAKDDGGCENVSFAFVFPFRETTD